MGGVETISGWRVRSEPGRDAIATDHRGVSIRRRCDGSLWISGSTTVPADVLRALLGERGR
jgi:hypothetical protein